MVFEQNFAFSIVIFVPMRQFDSDFYRFLHCIFILNGVLNPFTVQLIYTFLLVKKNSFICFRICPAMFFLNRRLHRLFLRPLTFSITVNTTALQLKFVCMMSFVCCTFKSIA